MSCFFWPVPNLNSGEAAVQMGRVPIAAPAQSHLFGQEWPILMLFSPEENRVAREALYETVFGPLTEDIAHSTDLQIVHIDIYKFAPSAGRPFWTLVTGGMSDLRQPALAEPRQGMAPRAELMMYASWPEGWMLSVLKGLAEMPFKDATYLHWGHTVPNGMPMTAEPSELTSFFFDAPVDEPQELMELNISGDGVDFVVVIPITEAERGYAIANGSTALVELMDERKFDRVVDEQRMSLV